MVTYDLNVTYTFDASQSAGDPTTAVITTVNIPLYVSEGGRGASGRGGRTWPRELSLDWIKIAFLSVFYRKLH